MNSPISDDSLDQLFRNARTFNGWQDREVGKILIRALYDLMKWGPTSANCSPLRVTFIASKEAKARLAPHMDDGNVEKTLAAPITAILATDVKFADHLPVLFPHADAKSWFEGNEKKTMETAWRNGTLQAGYFILAARSLGLDCGPMSGYEEESVNEEFFKDTSFKVNFVCNLGYGDKKAVYPRTPRLSFEEACTYL